jgi:hypothetical protein
MHRYINRDLLWELAHMIVVAKLYIEVVCILKHRKADGVQVQTSENAGTADISPKV